MALVDAGQLEIKTVIWLAATAAVLGMWLMCHELAHAQCCEYFGGMPSFSFDANRMVAITSCTVSGETLQELNSMNEIIGYMSLVVICSTMLAGYLIAVRDDICKW